MSGLSGYGSTCIKYVTMPGPEGSLRDVCLVGGMKRYVKDIHTVEASLNRPTMGTDIKWSIMGGDRIRELEYGLNGSVGTQIKRSM